MGIVSRGFTGRRRPGDENLPPGQYLVTDFPVLSAGPTPRVDLARWEFRVTTETGQARTWDWAAFRALPSEQITVDLHCVTKWSKLRTPWHGVPIETLLAQVQTTAGFALARSYGASTLQIFAKIRFPLALPMIIVGFMVGSIFGLLTAVGGEMVAASEQGGLGKDLVYYSSLARMSEFGATILIIAMLGVGIYIVFYMVGKRWASWEA